MESRKLYEIALTLIQGVGDVVGKKRFTVRIAGTAVSAEADGSGTLVLTV